MENYKSKKNKIIEKSMDLIYRGGYHGTGIQQIADAAGIPKGSFYYYFKNKEDYAVECLLFFFSQMKENNMRFLSDSDINPLKRILVFFEANIKDLEDVGLIKGCLIGNLTEEMGDQNDLIAEVAENIQVEITSEISRCIREEQELVGIKTGLDQDMIADFIINNWQGALIRMKSARNRRPLDIFLETTSFFLIAVFQQ
ncbi:MAG: TetR family transcriptional regulator C-terminal domain-containing protein [Gudongella sp.]|nr:TetR family transcriptional regulator C-terminal domain-containing protein [Gudongella sp.]